MAAITLEQTLYCSGTITDSQNIWNGRIRADPVRLVNDSKSGKIVFYYQFSSQVSSKIRKRKFLPVYCTVDKMSWLLISTIISISGDSWDTDAFCSEMFIDSDCEEEKKKAQSDSSASRDAAVGHCHGLWGHRSTRNLPRWKRPGRFPGDQHSPTFPVLNRLNLGLLISLASSSQMQFAAKRLFISRSPNWTGSAAVNNCRVLSCQSRIRQWKTGKRGSVPLSAERREKRRFVCCRVIIRTGIYQAIKPSVKRITPLKVTPGMILSGGGGRHGGTRLPDSPCPLSKPFKSSSLQPSAWSLTWSITCWSGKQPPPLRFLPLGPRHPTAGWARPELPVCSGPSVCAPRCLGHVTGWILASFSGSAAAC